MIMKKILDSYALMIFLEKEPGFEKIESLFIDAIQKDNNLLMATVNYGEVYYIVLRECGQEKLNEIEKIIDTLPIDVIDVDKNIVKQAARFKASKKISYADCFAAALAKINNGEVITGDEEFKVLKKEVKVLWV
ncbi:MAG: type II toxin-antitoxin system VapC family toxin [Actinobacteria bacterium]|nr:type II toxin-antitoxin system VapC family toxin [Actinomycetota bacterium]